MTPRLCTVKITQPHIWRTEKRNAHPVSVPPVLVLILVVPMVPLVALVVVLALVPLLAVHRRVFHLEFVVSFLPQA